MTPEQIKFNEDLPLIEKVEFKFVDVHIKKLEKTFFAFLARKDGTFLNSINGWFPETSPINDKIQKMLFVK